MATPEEKRAAAIAAFNQSLSELHATNPQGLGAGRYQDKIVRDSLLPASQRPGYKPGPERTYIDKNKEQSFIQQFGENLGSVTANPFTALSIAAATTPTEFVDNASVGTPTSEMPNAIVGQNPAGMGPDGSYGWDIATQSAKAGAPGLEPGGMTTEGEETVIDWATPGLEHPMDAIKGWATPSITPTSTASGFTPDTISEGPHEDEPTYAYDPIPGRNLGVLDSSKGSFYDAYMAPQTKGSIGMGWLGSLIGPAMPARGLATWAGRTIAGDKPSGWAGRLGALGQGDRFANSLAAQHYADKGPEGWLQSGFVGNYNPQSAGGLWSPGSQMHQVGSEGDVSATIGDIGAYLGGLFSGDEAEGEENGGGWGWW